MATLTDVVVAAEENFDPEEWCLVLVDPLLDSRHSPFCWNMKKPKVFVSLAKGTLERKQR